jgi:hypothetical protein
MKSFMGFIIFVVVVVVVLLMFPGKEYPRIPDDGFHQGVTDPAACMDCHGPGRRYEIKKTHPPKFECLKCHRRKAA